MQKEIDRRGMIGLISATSFASFSACYAENAVEPVEAPTLRQRGDVGDTASLARALATGRPVYLPAGGGTGQGGDYVVDMLELRHGSTINGNGEGTVIRSSNPRIPSVFVVKGRAVPTRNITLRAMKLVGYSVTDGFREHHNLVDFSGITNCLIERVFFEGFAGDAVYIGAEQQLLTRTPCNNTHVKIRDCVFDGVNHANRNAVSVTGGTDIIIENCTFTRCTSTEMPGPIDFEADDFPFYVFDLLSVNNCTFDRCGGNVGQISIVTPPNVRQLPRNIRIADNRFSNYKGSGSDIAVTVSRAATNSMPNMEMLIENNVGIDGRAGVRLYSGRGITLRNNHWTRYSGQTFIGYAGARDVCRDISVADKFEMCGTTDGVALGIFNADNVSIVGSSFIDCGNGRADSACIRLGSGRSSSIAIRNNDFTRAGSAACILRAADHMVAGPIELEPANLPKCDAAELR